MLPSVWGLVAEAIDDQRIILPRAVYRELLVYDDDLAAWINERSAAVVEPSEEVQQLAGTYPQEFPNSPARHEADPFILAEAQIRGFTVVTYEGTSFSGVPTRSWAKSMPGVGQCFEIACCTLPEALRDLGLSL
jgi:hypothetical protein